MSMRVTLTVIMPVIDIGFRVAVLAISPDLLRVTTGMCRGRGASWFSGHRVCLRFSGTGWRGWRGLLLFMTRGRRGCSALVVIEKKPTKGACRLGYEYSTTLDCRSNRFLALRTLKVVDRRRRARNG
jgi:hypothetical protein